MPWVRDRIGRIEVDMRTLFKTLILAAVSFEAYAAIPPVPVPEPESLGLLAIGVLGMLIALHSKRK